jgi:RNA polymerase sigma-70 factor (ECF subfamily)
VAPSSDNGLWQQMLAGDENAFLELYRRRHKGIYRFARQMSGSEAVAEDVTQEVFLALFRSPRQFDPDRGSLATYLFGIAHKQLLRIFERNQSLVPLMDDEDDTRLLGSLASTADTLGDLTRAEGIERLQQAILALPPHYREVVVLCDLEEMSYADAAETIGCSLGTIRSRRHRAHTLLIEKLRPDTKANSNRSMNIAP